MPEVHWNQIGDDGVQSVVEACRANNGTAGWQPQALDLSNNDLADVAADLLCTGLCCAQLEHLRYLDLYLNRIGPAGAKTLAGGLRLGHSALTDLNLGSNRILDGGLSALDGCSPDLHSHCLAGLDLRLRGRLITCASN